MAVKTVKILTDDIDGTEADETVAFSLDGKDYEMELSADNAAALRNVLAPYVEKARRVTQSARTSAKPASRGKSESGLDIPAVRAWARSNGWPNLSDRGRIPREIQEAYIAAGN